MKKGIIVIDLDNTLRDISAQMCKVYNRYVGCANDSLMSPCDIKDYDINKSMSELKKHVSAIDLKHFMFIEHAREVFYLAPIMQKTEHDYPKAYLSELQRFYRIIIATCQYTDTNKMYAIDWLKINNVPYDDIIFTNDKSWIECDVMVDDNIDFLRNSIAKCKFLFSQPYNERFGNEFERIGSIKELTKLLELK